MTTECSQKITLLFVENNLISFNCSEIFTIIETICRCFLVTLQRYNAIFSDRRLRSRYHAEPAQSVPRRACAVGTEQHPRVEVP
jgi:hypothetical protein